jgi:aldose 1-epimerase
MSFKVSIDDQKGFPIITLIDSSSGTEAEIYAFGGLLNAFSVPVNGSLFNLVEGFTGREDIMTHITNGFKSAKLSPFVCRMFEGKYQFNNIEYQVHKHFLNGHAIHGLVYDGIYAIKNQGSSDKGASVTLQYDYKGEDAGYPFPYTVMIEWKLESGNKLSVTTTVFHNNTHSIPMADGWHPYFTLGGSVDEWKIQFDSNTQLEYDAALLPSGKKLKDDRFINGSTLKDLQLDNSFELDINKDDAKCVLSNDTLKLIIEPDKSYPLLQLYIPPHRKSIAIENLSGAPDNFNNGMWRIDLLPNEQKIFTTSYTVVLNR